MPISGSFSLFLLPLLFFDRYQGYQRYHRPQTRMGIGFALIPLPCFQGYHGVSVRYQCRRRFDHKNNLWRPCTLR